MVQEINWNKKPYYYLLTYNYYSFFSGDARAKYKLFEIGRDKVFSSLPLALTINSPCRFFFAPIPIECQEYLKESARLEHREAMFFLAVAHINGYYGFCVDLNLAVVLLRTAAVHGCCRSLYELAEIAIEKLHTSRIQPQNVENSQKDFSFILECLKKSADMGCSWAQRKLGNAHEFGLFGLQVNNQAAFDLYKEAGCYFRLAEAFERGSIGVIKNYKVSLSYYISAASSENRFNDKGEACLRLGQIYELGELDIDIDEASSLRYYKDACDLYLNIVAMSRIAKANEFGELGLKVDKSLAISIYTSVHEKDDSVYTSDDECACSLADYFDADFGDFDSGRNEKTNTAKISTPLHDHHLPPLSSSSPPPLSSKDDDDH